MAKSRRSRRSRRRTSTVTRTMKKKITNLKKTLSLFQKSLKTRTTARKTSTHRRRGRRHHHRRSKKTSK